MESRHPGDAEMKKRLADIKAFAIDMDGTIYLGRQLFPFSVEFLSGLQKAGKRVMFLTNNSSKNAADYQQKLTNLGIEVSREQIYTSGDATIEYLNRIKPGSRIFLAGTPNLAEEFDRAGFTLTEDKPDFVVLGFDLTFNYEKFEKAARFLRKGVPFIATHPDFNCPIENGDMIPDCGALTAAFIAATGVRPKVIGKPNREMLEGLLHRAGVKQQQLCLMGDRLMTDIRMGQDFGIMTILVLTGETKREHLENSELQPDLVLEKNIDLLDYL